MPKFQDYPLLALRGRVVFPNTTVSFDVGRIMSLTAVKAATDADSRLFVCAQKFSEKDEITDDDVFTVGTVVKLRQIAKLPGNNLRLTVEGAFPRVGKAGSARERLLYRYGRGNNRRSRRPLARRGVFPHLARDFKGYHFVG